MRDNEGEIYETWMPWIPQGYGREHVFISCRTMDKRRYLRNVPTRYCQGSHNYSTLSCLTPVNKRSIYIGRENQKTFINRASQAFLGITHHSWTALGFWSEYLYQDWGSQGHILETRLSSIIEVFHDFTEAALNYSHLSISVMYFLIWITVS